MKKQTYSTCENSQFCVVDSLAIRAAPDPWEWRSGLLCGPLGQCWREFTHWPGAGGSWRWPQQSVWRLTAAPVPAAVYVVRLNVCACVCSLPGLYIEDEGVAFKNNTFLT